MEHTPIRPIRDEEGHAAALAEVERLMDLAPEPGTPDGDRLEVLLALVGAYEEKRFPIPEADAPSILAFAMEDMGRDRAELDRILGSAEAAGRVLARRAHMTADQSAAVERAWSLPAGLLGRPYWLEGQPG